MLKKKCLGFQERAVNPFPTAASWTMLTDWTILTNLAAGKFTGRQNRAFMKNIICFILCVFSFAVLCAQERFDNYPLPSAPDTLKILAVGNSFSDDGTEYIPGLLEAAGIRNVIIARLYIGGCSLERHCKEYSEGLQNYTYYKSTDNRWVTVSKNATMLDGLKDEAWDVITVQESSGISGTYDNYSEWLPQLIGIIRKEALNPQAAIVWHETWAYATNSVHGMFKVYGGDQQKMYSSIVECVDRATKEFNIPVVIPCGDAVQYARGTRLNNIGEVPSDCKVYDLTRDGYHLSRQFGRYIAACTWFETLIQPTLGISVKHNSYTMRDTEYSISAKDARLCRKCAVKAVRDKK